MTMDTYKEHDHAVSTIHIPTPGGFASFQESSQTKLTPEARSQCHPTTFNNILPKVRTMSLESFQSRCTHTTDGMTTSTNSTWTRASILDILTRDDHKNDADDSSSVSSLWASGELDHDEDNILTGFNSRPIFTEYWNKTGENPLSLTREVTDIITIKKPPHLTARAPLAEGQLNHLRNNNNNKCNSNISTARSNDEVSSSHRKIFNFNRNAGFNSHSTPTLLEKNCAGKGQLLQTIQSKSTPALLKTRKSCLRSSYDEKKSQNVAFSENVSISKYNNPMEIWGSSGWFAWFG